MAVVQAVEDLMNFVQLGCIVIGGSGGGSELESCGNERKRKVEDGYQEG